MSEEIIPTRGHKLKSKPSFNSKNSLGRMNAEGGVTRPVPTIPSQDRDPGMTDKLHSLMDSYIPKDIPSI